MGGHFRTCQTQLISFFKDFLGIIWGNFMPLLEIDAERKEMIWERDDMHQWSLQPDSKPGTFWFKVSTLKPLLQWQQSKTEVGKNSLFGFRGILSSRITVRVMNNWILPLGIINSRSVQKFLINYVSILFTVDPKLDRSTRPPQETRTIAWLPIMIINSTIMFYIADSVSTLYCEIKAAGIFKNQNHCGLRWKTVGTNVDAIRS